MKARSAAYTADPHRKRRGAITMVILLFLGSTLPGCVTARNMIALHHRDPMAGAPRMRNAKNPKVDEVLAHLNQNTNKIESWRANRVRIAFDGWSVSGSIAVQKDRHLRIEVSSMRGKEVDMGSNDERFWLWSREMEPGFVTCKHENMDMARRQVGIPFEPDWLMQALGVSPIPTTGVTMQSDPANEQVRLIEHVMSAHGQPLRRAVLVDLKRGGIVVEHCLYDYNGVPIAMAKLGDHRLDKESGVVLPRRIALEFPQNKKTMTMTLADLRVNPSSFPADIWEMPTIRDCEVVHLDAGAPAGGIRIVTRPDSLSDSDGEEPVQTIRSHDDHNFLRENELPEDDLIPDEAPVREGLEESDEPEFHLPSKEAPPGRSRISTPQIQDFDEEEEEADNQAGEDWSN